MISPGTRVTVFYPDLVGIELQEQRVLPVASGEGWVEFDAPKGTHSVRLILNRGAGVHLRPGKE